MVIGPISEKMSGLFVCAPWPASAAGSGARKAASRQGAGSLLLRAAAILRSDLPQSSAATPRCLRKAVICSNGSSQELLRMH